MIVTRRKFFFFGLSAGIGLLLPNNKIELIDYCSIKDLRIPLQINPSLYGIPYHYSNASSGTWLGFSRAESRDEIINLIKILEEDKAKNNARPK